MTTTVDKIIAALRIHKNVLLYGPPGTGKSHLMKEVALRFTPAASPANPSDAVYIDTDDERVPLRTAPATGVMTRWVTFHQGYSYEDFILGLRPQSGTGTLFSLVPRPGVLLELAAEAAGGTGLLLIDEINRGNTSRIFGEFITLMEPEKRLGQDGQSTATTVQVTLPYLAPGELITIQTSNGNRDILREFAMPASVYTLASMNSVDKSVAPIDTALRRRFHTINLFPSILDLRAAVGLSATDSMSLERRGALSDVASVARLAVAVVERLNRGIGLQLGPDFMIGQWYLHRIPAGTVEEARAALVDIWQFRIVPQLLELFHGRTDALVGMLKLDSLRAGSGIAVQQPTTDELEAGGATYVATRDPAPADTEIIDFLQRFADAPEPAQPDSPVV